MLIDSNGSPPSAAVTLRSRCSDHPPPPPRGIRNSVLCARAALNQYLMSRGFLHALVCAIDSPLRAQRGAFQRLKWPHSITFHESVGLMVKRMLWYMSQ
ncbi:hypothetical protein CDAR_95421 [Caerostris darwini]|uniref:Uncharacterized protein n=1 Tax=Caerostris darwini TaxID=1538125 RepID=A0AAV4PKY4_9ARAC|nr:hypothetical protein CDAR_95421 [Caerostris darwini]